MAVIESQLVQAYVLQDYFVDKDTSEALAGGKITLYKDKDRQILKNWFYLTGTVDNYFFKTLPNPMTLSAVGTIEDDNGNDVIPFFYPFSEVDNSPETYYITVDNSTAQRQFTRQNFPFIADRGQGLVVPTYQNILVNNRFWRNITILGGPNGITPQSTDLTNITSLVVCPSQHDGFHEPDMMFKKDIKLGSDFLTFKSFDSGASKFLNDIRPEYYLNHVCTTNLINDLNKYYQIPISLRLKTLDSVEASFTIWARANSVSANNILNIKIQKYYGTDNASASPTPFVVGDGTITLTPDWKKTHFRFTFRSTSGVDLPSKTGDDAYFLRIELPQEKSFNVDFCIPSIYLSDEVPTNEFETYDKSDSIINDFRTGDIRSTFNRQNKGWVPVDGGSIGSPLSNSTARNSIDTWPLFNLIWNSVSEFWAPMFTSTGAVSTRGASALDDFNANKRMILPLGLGHVLASGNPSFETEVDFTVNITTSEVTVVTVATDVITLASVTGLQTGSPIRFTAAGTMPTPLVALTVYYVNLQGGTDIKVYASRENAIDDVSHIVITAAGALPITANNIDFDLTLASSTELLSGTPVLLKVTGGTLPSDLTPDFVYYAVQDPTDLTKIKLSTDFTYAELGFEEGFWTAGSGTKFTLFSSLGSDVGLSHQVLTEAQLAEHTHPFASDNTFLSSTIGSESRGEGDALRTLELVTGTTNATGDNAAHNIMQPTTFVNMYIKL